MLIFIIALNLDQHLIIFHIVRNAANANHQVSLFPVPFERHYNATLYPRPLLVGGQVLPHSEHLGAHVCRESIHLLAVLLHLLRVQHALKSAGLLRKLEESLPLILGERSLLGGSSLGILGLSLCLPCCDLGLLTAQLSLVELEVVEVGVVGLDALEEEVACLLKEGVDGKVEVVDGRIQRGLDFLTVEVSQ